MSCRALFSIGVMLVFIGFADLGRAQDYDDGGGNYAPPPEDNGGGGDAGGGEGGGGEGGGNPPEGAPAPEPGEGGGDGGGTPDPGGSFDDGYRDGARRGGDEEYFDDSDGDDSYSDAEEFTDDEADPDDGGLGVGAAAASNKAAASKPAVAPPVVEKPAPAADPKTVVVKINADPKKPHTVTELKPASGLKLTPEKIKAVQQALNQSGAKVKVDGVMGAGTKAALVAFQAKHSLASSAVVDQQTLAKLGVTP